MGGTLKPIVNEIPWEVVIPSSFAVSRIHALTREPNILELTLDRARRIVNYPFDRAQLSSQIVAKLSRLNAPAASLQNAARLGESRSIVVLTGQQPGFLGGPMYTFFKALHCLVVARELQKQWDGPVIPMFWNHSDDHDIDETRVIHLLDSRGELHRFSADFGKGRPFLSDVRFGSDITEKLERIFNILPFGKERTRVMDLVRVSEGRPLAEFFNHYLLQLFGSRGLVVFEPNDIRNHLSNSLATIVNDVSAATDRLRARATEVLKEGFVPAFTDDDPSIIYERTELGRERIHFDGKKFLLASGQRLDPPELATLVRAQAARFTSGVATRLITELLSIPAVSTIRGPAELSYSPLSQCFLPSEFQARALPVEYPRFSATIIDESLVRNINNTEFDIRKLFSMSREDIRVQFSINKSPIYSNIELLRSHLLSNMNQIKPGVLALDQNLARPFEKTISSVSSAIESLLSKIQKADDERSNINFSRLDKLHSWMLPGGKPQERVLPAIQFLCDGLESRVQSIMDIISVCPKSHALVTFQESEI
ncbi:MAG: bacillithiol biosynthesis BshC [Planctomycetota bacterium]